MRVNDLQKRDAQRDTEATSNDELMRHYPPQPPYSSVPQWYADQNEVDEEYQDGVYNVFERKLDVFVAL